jgi:hypothetical protein
MRREWFAVLAGPLAWFAAHVASWMIAPGAHESASRAALWVIDLVALAIAVVGGAVGLGRLRALGAAESGERATDRARFVAASGVGLSALSVLLVLGLTLPTLLLLPGAEP